MDMQTTGDWIERLRNKEYAIREHHRDMLAEIITALEAQATRDAQTIAELCDSVERTRAEGQRHINDIEAAYLEMRVDSERLRYVAERMTVAQFVQFSASGQFTAAIDAAITGEAK